MSKSSASILLRTEPELHRRLIRRAKALDISLNELCSRRLSVPSLLETSSLSHLRTVIRDVETLLGRELLGVVLYGSQARGEASTGSDWDVLVVPSAAVVLDRGLYRRLDQLMDPTLERVEVHFAHLPAKTHEAAALWGEIALDGIVLCERDLALSQHLARVRRDIAAGVIVRRTAHGQSYWVHTEVA